MSIRDIGAVLSASELAWWDKGFRHSSHRRSSIETAIAALKWKRTLVFARLTRTCAPLKSGGIHRKGSLSWTTNLHKTVYIWISFFTKTHQFATWGFYSSPELGDACVIMDGCALFFIYSIILYYFWTVEQKHYKAWKSKEKKCITPIGFVWKKKVICT